MLREKQLTVRATKRPVEYNYTNADIHHHETEPCDGYQLEYPVNWTGDPSTNKVIGIRRIDYKPTSLTVAVRFSVIGSDSEVPIDINMVFTDQNTFEECIAAIVTKLNEELEAKLKGTTCTLNYNKELATCTLKFDQAPDLFADFKISFPSGFDPYYDPKDPSHFRDEYIHYKAEFLKLFNQHITKDNIDMLYTYQYGKHQELTFENVWNRDSFYCHASFSDSPKQIIGINKDFWPTPSVFYAPSDNSNDFNVYFTTDTVHRILPRNGVMLIQLSYIFNYTNSMLSYV